MAVTTGPKCVLRNVSVCGVPLFDRDRLGVDLHVAPRAVEQVLVRVVRIGLEEEQVRLVGPEGGQAPGDVRREADQDARAARDADAAGVEGLAADVEFLNRDGLRTGVCGSLMSTAEPVVVLLPPTTQAWLNRGPGRPSPTGTSTFRIRLCSFA